MSGMTNIQNLIEAANKQTDMSAIIEAMVTKDIPKESLWLGKLSPAASHLFSLLFEFKAQLDLLKTDSESSATLTVQILMVDAALQDLLTQQIQDYKSGEVLVVTNNWTAVRIESKTSVPLSSSLESEALAANQE